MRMMLGSLREVDPNKESVEDFDEHFEFYYMAKGNHDDNAAKKRAMFITLLGQENFAKLKVLASPTTMNNLTLDATVQLLSQYFCLPTIEIAEWFKFFKRKQMEDESAMEYTGQLRRLGQTCNFGAYLETVLQDQFVCGLSDVNCQRDLLCDAAVAAETALKKARASEVVLKETEEMQSIKETGDNCSN